VKWYVYGEVYFTGNAKRNGAKNRADNTASRLGFTAEAWPLLVEAFGSWPAGAANITGTDDTGATVPGFRFCYSMTDQATAEEAIADIGAAWDVFQDTNSWWAYAAVP
jgi:hypothetical protein